MNDTLDVLRYWLPEIQFEVIAGVLYWDDEEQWHQSIDFGCKPGPSSAILCTELRRKYLESGIVRAVSTYSTPDGWNFVTVMLVLVGRPAGSLAHIKNTEDDGKMTELLATIAAGKRLKEALEPGEGT